jgi:hypothetical protein
MQMKLFFPFLKKIICIDCFVRNYGIMNPKNDSLNKSFLMGYICLRSREKS